MRKITCIAFFLILIPFISSAQSKTFAFDSSNTTLTITENEFYEVVKSIYNLTDSVLGVLEWEKLSDSFNPDWEYGICDNVYCYTGVPDDGVFGPFDTNETAYLKLTINTMDIPGSGTLSFRVFNPENSNESDTVVFTIVSEPSGIFTVKQHRTQFTVFPNPVTDEIFIPASNSAVEFTVFAPDGRIVKSGKIGAEVRSSVKVSDLNSGLYTIRLSNSEGMVKTSTFIKN
jgi:hypothetical protein